MTLQFGTHTTSGGQLLLLILVGASVLPGAVAAQHKQQTTGRSTDHLAVEVGVDALVSGRVQESRVNGFVFEKEFPAGAAGSVTMSIEGSTTIKSITIKPDKEYNGVLEGDQLQLEVWVKKSHGATYVEGWNRATGPMGETGRPEDYDLKVKTVKLSKNALKEKGIDIQDLSAPKKNVQVKHQSHKRGDNERAPFGEFANAIAFDASGDWCTVNIRFVDSSIFDTLNFEWGVPVKPDSVKFNHPADAPQCSH